jgi:hypothetical protein
MKRKTGLFLAWLVKLGLKKGPNVLRGAESSNGIAFDLTPNYLDCSVRRVPSRVAFSDHTRGEAR